MSTFTWSASGQDLPMVEAHTKARHRVTEDYVRDWIITLCGNNIGQSKKVTLIDGFCGGGMYIDEESGKKWPGSPIRLIRSVEEGLRHVKEKKGKPEYELDAKFIFIDSSQEHIDCLKKQLIESGLEDYALNDQRCQFICLDFESTLPILLEQISIRKGSSLFVLDPTGYTDVSMPSIRKIMGFKTTEILYTFMIDYITRFVRMRDGSLKDAFERILEADGFFRDLSCIENFETQDKKGYIRNETLRLFRYRGTAEFAYSFALLPSSGTVKYYLIHLATSPAAQRVIKCSLWEHNNLDLAYQFRYETHGLGFRSSSYYEKNLNLINIEEENSNICIQNLNNDLLPLIESHDEGITFDRLHTVTMQRNPATIDHYAQYINLQRSYGEIEVLREGRVTKAKTLKGSDIIRKPRQKMLFDMRKI